MWKRLSASRIQAGLNWEEKLVILHHLAKGQPTLSVWIYWVHPYEHISLLLCFLRTRIFLKSTLGQGVADISFDLSAQPNALPGNNCSPGLFSTTWWELSFQSITEESDSPFTSEWKQGSWQVKKLSLYRAFQITVEITDLATCFPYNR